MTIAFAVFNEKDVDCVTFVAAKSVNKTLYLSFYIKRTTIVSCNFQMCFNIDDKGYSHCRANSAMDVGRVSDGSRAPSPTFYIVCSRLQPCA